MLNKVNDEHAARPPPTPRETHCTGCNVRYTEDYPADQTCPDCGYTTCESCACHDSRGSCYCQASNFGYKYCEREPRPYHLSSHTGKLYSGDYHPDESKTENGPTVRPDLYEDAPRKCNSCGEVKLCLKPGSARWYRQEYSRFW
ncbi:hypothetical protein AURDEDRAFT_158083 [Auricularia subglabra TFB-10046 SS5]|nr:hypothetical protein AURDEDRAFT_158083 [Auricularia subglabra TFB-10046 SS5]